MIYLRVAIFATICMIGLGFFHGIKSLFFWQKQIDLHHYTFLPLHQLFRQWKFLLNVNKSSSSFLDLLYCQQMKWNFFISCQYCCLGDKSEDGKFKYFNTNCCNKKKCQNNGVLNITINSCIHFPHLQGIFEQLTLFVVSKVNSLKLPFNAVNTCLKRMKQLYLICKLIHKKFILWPWD